MLLKIQVEGKNKWVGKIEGLFCPLGLYCWGWPSFVVIPSFPYFATMSPPTDPLDLLEELRSPPPVPPGMRREVWQRIAASETSLTESPAWSARLVAAFTRPSFALAFVAACMCLGLFLAEWRVAQAEVARSHQIAQSYLALIDPLFVGSSRHSTQPVSP